VRWIATLPGMGRLHGRRGDRNAVATLTSMVESWATAQPFEGAAWVNFELAPEDLSDVPERERLTYLVLVYEAAFQAVSTTRPLSDVGLVVLAVPLINFSVTAWPVPRSVYEPAVDWFQAAGVYLFSGGHCAHRVDVPLVQAPAEPLVALPASVSWYVQADGLPTSSGVHENGALYVQRLATCAPSPNGDGPAQPDNDQRHPCSGGSSVAMSRRPGRLRLFIDGAGRRRRAD